MIPDWYVSEPFEFLFRSKELYKLFGEITYRLPLQQKGILKYIASKKTGFFDNFFFNFDGFSKFVPFSVNLSSRTQQCHLYKKIWFFDTSGTPGGASVVEWTVFSPYSHCAKGPKGQLISKQDCRAVTSPKKQT